MTNQDAYEALFDLCKQDPATARLALMILFTARGTECGPPMFFAPAVNDETSTLDGLMLSINLNRIAGDLALKTLAIALIEFFLAEAAIDTFPPEYIDAMRKKLDSLKSSAVEEEVESIRIIS